MSTAAGKKRWTVAQYLEMEAHSLDKHEFFDGEIVDMPGASPEHNLIVGNLYFEVEMPLPGPHVRSA